MTAFIHRITGQAGSIWVVLVSDPRPDLWLLHGNRVEMYWSRKKRCNLRFYLGSSESFISSVEKFVSAHGNLFLTVVIL